MSKEKSMAMLTAYAMMTMFQDDIYKMPKVDPFKISSRPCGKLAKVKRKKVRNFFVYQEQHTPNE